MWPVAPLWLSCGMSSAQLDSNSGSTDGKSTVTDPIRSFLSRSRPMGPVKPPASVGAASNATSREAFFTRLFRTHPKLDARDGGRLPLVECVRMLDRFGTSALWIQDFTRKRSARDEAWVTQDEFVALAVASRRPVSAHPALIEKAFRPLRPYISRRSPVMGLNGAAATSNHQATNVAIEILRAGGNCVDACVAVIATLNVLEPTSTGIGGDMFMLHYDAKTRKVTGLNGSGRAPKALTLARARTDLSTGPGSSSCPPNAATPELKIPFSHAHGVTVPGAAAGWCDAVQKYGNFPMSRVLAPAIHLAESGFPIGSVVSELWRDGAPGLRAQHGGSNPMLVGPRQTRAPLAGECFRNPDLARTFREIARGGKKAFYEGRIARAIVDAVKERGGLMDMKDLSSHETDAPEPIKVRYRGVDVWEIPPNGQGITALLALNLLEQIKADFSDKPHGSPEHLHLLIEAMRIAFADSRWYVADPQHTRVPIADLLSPAYAARRAKLFDPTRASVDVKKGSPTSACGTVSFCVVDGDGNACSFINSNYAGFGTGIVPKGCGFTLQNRGCNFSLQEGHPNCLAPGKRPYHTIIPGMATRGETGALLGPFSVMGGFMQPQGHVQLLVNLLDYKMGPQLALDMPRFCIFDGTSGGAVALEAGIPDKTVQALRDMGHRVQVVTGHDRRVFGRGQVILQAANGVFWAGSDGRADGAAVGFTAVPTRLEDPKEEGAAKAKTDS